MTLTLDASSPARVNTTTLRTITTASFTPPANSLLLVLVGGDSTAGKTVDPATVTDNLGTHLTYNLVQHTAHGYGSPTTDGWTTVLSANVITSATMTVTASFAGAPATGISLKVMVFTDSSGVRPTIGASGRGAQNSGTAIVASYTATMTDSRGVISVIDWAAGTLTAGSGCTTTGGSSDTYADFSYAAILRTAADGVVGSTTTLNVTDSISSVALRWIYVEVCPVPSGTVQDKPSAGMRTASSRLTLHTTDEYYGVQFIADSDTPAEYLPYHEQLYLIPVSTYFETAGGNNENPGKLLGVRGYGRTGGPTGMQWVMVDLPSKPMSNRIDTDIPTRRFWYNSTSRTTFRTNAIKLIDAYRVGGSDIITMFSELLRATSRNAVQMIRDVTIPSGSCTSESQTSVTVPDVPISDLSSHASMSDSFVDVTVL